MAKIALIQTYPYDAIAGGDGAYIQSLAQYLHQTGHDVYGLVTDMTRGRTRPIYESFYPVERYRSWRVRNAVRVSPRAFVNCNFSGISARVLEKLRCCGSRMETDQDEWAHREALWSSKQLEKLHPDVTILCFGAVHFASVLRDVYNNILALPGPIPGRKLWSTSPNQPSWEDQSKIAPTQAKLASALAYADRVGLNSRDDLAYAIKYLNVKRGIVVGMGFPSQVIFPESSEQIILFVGNATEANRAGVHWFLTKVWPVVRASCPDARFRIVGRIAFSNEARDGVAVERIGPVADLAPEYRQAQVVIAPLLFGTAGVKIKVAEAMSYGRPLVVTSVGADGDPGQLDPGGIVVDDCGDFARGIIALLRDANLRREKSMGAAKVFTSCFSYNSSYGEITRWIDQVVSGAGSRTAQDAVESRNYGLQIKTGPILS
jgi:glycosyltransferase involved in cell wall biosynthesis